MDGQTRSRVLTGEPGGGIGISDPGEIDLVRDWIVGTVASAGGSADRIRVRLTALHDGAEQLGQARLLWRGRPLRVQVLARSRPDAGLALVGRLAGRIESLVGGWHPRSVAEQLGAAVPLPAHGTGTVVRAKIADPTPCDPSYAMEMMDALDYDAYVFIDAATGVPAAVRRSGPLGYRLLSTRPIRLSASIPCLTVDPYPVLRLTVHEAIARAESTDRALLFFVDRDTDVSALLYARHHGGYGLVRIVP